MRAEPRWVDQRALLLLHEESLAEFVGPRGLRDEGLLDSALARPRNKRAYSEGKASIAELAATYAFGLASNHACVDGNKRLAFLSMGLFLALNGFRLKADRADAVRVMFAAAAGELDEAGLAAWVEGKMERA